MRRFLAILGLISVVAAFAAGIFSVGYRAALGPVSEQGQVYLRSAADRLVGQLARFRQLAVLTADHPDVGSIARQPETADSLLPLLLKMSDTSGALEIAYVDHAGNMLASSQPSHVGQSFAQTLHFQRAQSGALGFDHSVLNDGTRIFAFMAPVYIGGQAAGAVLVRVDMETVEESDWRSAPQVVFFTDTEKQIFVSNRSEILHQTFADTTGAAEFAPNNVTQTAGHTEWQITGQRFLPSNALYLELPQPIIGMIGHSLISTAPAQRLAGLQALVGAALSLVFGGFLFFMAERRRALSAVNVQLEARVAARTVQLTNANVNLRHEIAERREAEEALRKAQSDLVQAGKLSALGQMSAGISHELNQPLMAIRSFAENAVQFLDRDRPAEAANNLDRISELSRRMGRIIKNLRAFARQEHEPVTDVDITSVIDAVFELLQPRLHAEQVIVNRTQPDTPIWVRGGDVRLQQVVMNLVSNAADAMAESDEKQLDIIVQPAGSQVQVIVADSGPGLHDADKIFDPFYTTKEVGQSEGMGLGLSISYGLVQSFGGNITGRNRDHAGAEFTVSLTRSEHTDEME
ncbi:sensor histidine kinase [Cognatishimia sp. WU-CL00825]|uniref:ATP-binding protein n=1 Tax=Cognatishimia sp. WU-CL00825 TaxID=3127658 RepID=UPI0031057168